MHRQSQGCSEILNPTTNLLNLNPENFLNLNPKKSMAALHGGVKEVIHALPFKSTGSSPTPSFRNLNPKELHGSPELGNEGGPPCTNTKGCASTPNPEHKP